MMRRCGRAVSLLKHSISLLILVAALWAMELAAHSFTPLPQKKVQKIKRTEGAQNRRAKLDSLKPLLEQLQQRYRARPRAIPPGAQSSNMLKWARSPRGMQLWQRKEAKVYNHLKRGVVAVEPPAGKTMLSKRRQGETPSRLALRFVEENQAIFHIAEPALELVEHRRTSDLRGTEHLFFQQYHQGIPLWGRQLVAHVEASGELRSINCLIEPSPQIVSAPPQLSGTEAIALAYKQLEAEGAPATINALQAATVGLPPDSAKLYYWQTAPRANMALTWVVEVRPNLQDWMRFFIRAEDGKILEHYNATKTSDRTNKHANDQVIAYGAWNLAGQQVDINTFEIDGTYFMLDGSRFMFVGGQTSEQLLGDPKGVVAVFDLDNQDASSGASIYHFSSFNNVWNDPAAVSALDYGGQVYQYYYDLGGGLKRNSLDNAGASMRMLLHITSGGEPMDNAFWNGSFVGLGDGDKRTIAWAGALDAIAHEFTHAHIQYTANLEYKYQSGALNETFADIGAISIDDDDFKLGEDIAIATYFPSGALRDMSDPHNGGAGPQDLDKGWQPAHMDEYIDLTLSEDNGGVHINNGISNHAAYNILNSLGRDEGEQVLFHALFNRLTQQANFADFRIAAVASAGELYGEGSEQQEKVKVAFEEVGIVEGGGTDPPEDKPGVDGSQYILFINDVPIDENTRDNSLIITDPFSSFQTFLGNQNYYYLSSAPRTQVNAASGRPVAIDPWGQDIFFIDSDYKLRAIYPDGTGEFEFNGPDGNGGINEINEWWSVAISPNSQKLAMTSLYVENIIYIFDFATNPIELTELTLLHPTTDPTNAYSDTVLFADALTFIDDQFLVYDSKNRIGSEGDTFWDVNAIDVVTGQIFPMLPPQPQGMNVVNPVVASTNNSILAVEMSVEGGIQAETVGINLYSGDQNSIYFNYQNEPTYPDYSVDDDYLLYSLTYLPDDTKDVWYIPLGEDKISQAGSSEYLVIEAQLPLWFAVGVPPTSLVGFEKPNSRALETNGIAQVAIMLDPAPTSDSVTVDYSVTGGNAIGGGVDYTLESGRVTFNVGESKKFIDIAIVDDGATEENETIVITLDRPVNTWLSEAVKHTHTIATPLFTAVPRHSWQLYK